MSVTRDTKTNGVLEWHAYHCTVHGVTDFPGATTIINKKGKGFRFEHWLKRQGALAAIRNLSALSQMVDTSGEDATVAFLGTAADKLRDDAGDRGTRIHHELDLILRRALDEALRGDDIRAPVDGARAWLNERRPDIKASEFMVISETHRYGATGDVVMEVDLREWGLPQERGLVLADWKTSGAVYDTTALQLAAIRWADHAGTPDGIFKVPQATHFGVLHVMPTETKLIPFDVTDREFQAFLACRELYYWDRERSRKVK